MAMNLGALLGTDRFRIADLRRRRLARFSLETPLRFLVRGGLRVELRVERVRRERAQH
jgi:predicted XRE-type DNA-binding protein